MTTPVALLDANVLYPARLRDLLIRLAIEGVYRARWSERILDECFDNIAADRPDLGPTRFERTRQLMNAAVADAVVTVNPEDLAGLQLPDPDDVHVLAAAIEADADFIVTWNLADFPDSATAAHDVVARTPDEFLLALATSDADAVVGVLTAQAAALKNPPMSVDALLDGLVEIGLGGFVEAVRSSAL